MRCLVDVLSLLRVLLVPVVVTLALTGNWTQAFLVLVVAWVTTLLDSAIARWTETPRKWYPDYDLDGVANRILALVSATVPGIYYTWIDPNTTVAVVLWPVYILTVIVGIAMVIKMHDTESPTTQWLVRINMPFVYGLVQIFAVIGWFGFIAYGPPAIAPVIIVAAMLTVMHWNTVRFWLHGRLR